MNNVAELSTFTEISGATPSNVSNGNNSGNGYWIFGVGIAISIMTMLYISKNNQALNYYDKGK